MYAKAGLAVTSGAVATLAWASFLNRSRPLRSEEDGCMGAAPHTPARPINRHLGQPAFKAEQERRSELQPPAPPPRLVPALCVAQALVTGFLGACSKFGVRALGSYTSFNEATLRDAVLHRPAEVSLVTVMNHASVADDPVLLSLALPLSLALAPTKMRLGTCSEEVCFKSRLLCSFFAAAKTLPLERGAGIEQPYLRELCAALSSGGWVNMFPEGGTVQGRRQRMGGRCPDDRASRLGRLKWGTAKLVLKSRGETLLLPLYHRGMDAIFPQEPNTKKLLHGPVPQKGAHVRLIVGKPIDLSSICAAHRESRLLARGLRPSAAGDEDAFAANSEALRAWDDTRADLALFSAVMRRVELELLELERQMDEEDAVRREATTRRASTRSRVGEEEDG